jgi:hypothetical protein
MTIMNTTQAMNLYINPLLAWNKLAYETCEMMVTSAQVILQRTNPAAFDKPYTSNGGRDDTLLIGQEKIDAMLESAQAIGAQVIIMGHQFASITCRQLLSASSDLMATGSSKTATESLNRHSKLIRKTINNSVITGSRLSASSEKIARSALKPLKKRVNKNAKRLVKHK